MNHYVRTALWVLTVIVVVVAAAGVAAQQPATGTAGAKVITPIPQPSVEMVFQANGGVQVIIRGKGSEELRVNAAGLTVSSGTMQSMKVVSEGPATVVRSGEAFEIRAEAMELTIGRDGSIKLSSNRLEMVPVR